ncbi:vancomycin permeability regulator SanA [Halomonas campaniensis]|uniref:Vancomycin permeability regulator SanA n=1 Tax=Halomonas campaniensis TaxID=213554 RepID=A0A7W5K6G1_9GAMM|nr:hypothetical protein [Halomonas campaniensis]MBB3332710.1 vancomycin permeability regulator SanA [Halomonas campaniensis]
MLASTEAWLAARKLRNQLIHEYMQDPVAFAEALASARQFSLMLMATYNSLRDYAEQRMSLDGSLPEALVLPDQHPR